jgi:hypothetical protein
LPKWAKKHEAVRLHFTLFGNKSSSLKTKGFLHIFINPINLACEVAFDGRL